jgi:hypothetical protein
MRFSEKILKCTYKVQNTGNALKKCEADLLTIWAIGHAREF